jgi:Rne/Rng family ribonuclease
MSKELFISTTPHETKVAIVENEELTEIYYERENEYTLAGSIYKGKVTRVLPGMQSAFVDIGLERDAFLYVTDFLETEEHDEHEQIEHAITKSTQPQREGRERPERRDREGRGDREGRREDRSAKQRISQRELSRQASADSGATVIEGDFTVDEPTFTTQTPQRHGGEVIPETAAEEGDGGARRYQGRRKRRRGGREVEEAQPRFAQRNLAPEESEEEVQRPASAGAAPAKFVLPGESLQKYGGQPAPFDDKKQQQRTLSGPRSKPSTEVDLSQVEGFDGFSLPGEKLSKYKAPESKSAAEAEVASEPSALSSEEPEVQPEHESSEPGAQSVAPTSQGPQGEDGEPQGDASASVDTEPDIMRFVFRRRKVRKNELDEELGDEQTAVHADLAPLPIASEEPETAEPQQEIEHREPQNSEAAALEAADEEESDIAEDAISVDAFEARQEIAMESVAVSDAPAHVFDPGHGDIEEVEEEYQDDEFEGIGAAEYAEDEFSFEELEEEEAVNEATEELLPAVARAAAADQIVEQTHEDFKPEGAGGFIEADFTGGEEEEELEDEEADSAKPGTQPRDRRGRQRRRMIRGRKNIQKETLPTISDLLKEGQEVLVQIAKEPMAKKGARITSHIALPGRFLVFMPTVSHVGVSRKIGNDEERQRLKRILLSEKGEAHGGFIVRTAAAGANEEDLRADIRFLINLWNEIKSRSDAGKSPALIYHDLNLVERILRDQVTNSFSAIWVDSEIEYERIVRFLSRFQPALVKRVKLYTKELPLYEQFGIQEEINKALKSKVWLKSGGYIVINQTEALVAIDINTGKYVGKTARLEDTIVKTNIDAIQEIVRQIRLRDLGGIIVIDFIDMDERKNRQKVMQALEEALKQDRAPSKVLQFNDFGLVAITRKRVKQSLERTLGSTCNYCQGTGFVKSVTTVCNEIYIEMRKMSKHLERHDVMLRVNPEVVKALKANNARWLQEMEELTRKTIIVKSDPTLHQEQFDIH